ncbi:MAG: hypothetical protein J6W16_01340 [Methanobrevibacter sp.]|nr:hypothetical protein [Methanobrevibacter sp.]
MLYDDWRNHNVVLSIDYVFNSGDERDNHGCLIAPYRKTPDNFKSENIAKIIAKQKDGDSTYDYRYENLRNGDDGFMCNWGNFDTYSSIIKVTKIDDQKTQNIQMLIDYINKDNWYIDYLKEQNKYDNFVALIDEYKSTGVFTDEMYKNFPTYLFYTPEEYMEVLKNDDCHSPFIHVYADVVAFGYYFHS